ncbi:hypothetical protein SP5_030_00440 [Sphingomonas parapaucimobilis NBRC 15100]|uniref:Uncharacterized protein n=1 Tax=Sphingomonas parapaucimobilis NBRC 15100 TaxID=1219049 RepID=A0A0A1W5F2_9SPHN|nr:hypothetical protein SP5_030_00440 [Sphingomonas parapaucimobilis NBRC 15100]
MATVAARFGPAMPQAPVETIRPLRITATEALSTFSSRRAGVISGKVVLAPASAIEAQASSAIKPA